MSNHNDIKTHPIRHHFRVDIKRILLLEILGRGIRIGGIIFGLAIGVGQFVGTDLGVLYQPAHQGLDTGLVRIGNQGGTA